jgi:hypothetical protein
MKILKPITTPQTVLIQPRKSDFYSVDDYEYRVESSSGLLEISDCIYDFFYDINEVSLIIRKDGEGVSETVSSISWLTLGNFLEIGFSTTILEEGETYSFSVLFGGDIIYKDKIYATAKDDFTIKHISVQDEYTTYNPVDDNTYIIR